VVCAGEPDRSEVRPTHRWREMDSNLRFPNTSNPATTARLSGSELNFSSLGKGLPDRPAFIERDGAKFAPDSALEESGFEPLVPLHKRRKRDRPWRLARMRVPAGETNSFTGGPMVRIRLPPARVGSEPEGRGSRSRLRPGALSGFSGRPYR